jgi:hypothetical protein
MTPDERTEPVDPPEALRALDEVVAPDRLRLAVAERVGRASRVRRRWGPVRLGVAAAAGWALAVAVTFVVLGVLAQQLIQPDSSRTTVRDVAPIALRAPAAPAPATRPGGEQLAAQAGPIVFPTWTHAGWRAVGARRDTVRGHDVRTVFYADAAGRRIGYAIADARLPVAGGQLVTWRGARLRVLAHGATSVVTWRRDGRTCILAGHGVPVGRLLTLASYAA